MRRFFKWARYQNCRQLFKECGQNVNVEKGASFHSGQNIKIGNNSGIGINSEIGGEVTIGSDVMMGPHVTLWTTNHNFSRTDIPMNQQGMGEEKPVIIQDDVWIGSHVIILPGVIVGKGVIIGAGSVVTKSIPEYTVAAGNPAKALKYRKKSEAA